MGEVHLGLHLGGAGCDVPQAQETLDVIIADEARNAALAWQTVRWAIEQGGSTVLDAALAHAQRRRGAFVEGSRVAKDPDAALRHAHGRLTHHEEHRLVARS